MVSLEPAAATDLREEGSGSSGDKLLLALRLFTPDRPVWSVEAIAGALAVSLSTAYRYVRSLVGAGLLDPVDGQGGYVLGPAVIEFDRTIRLSDPVLRAALPSIRWLARQLDGRSTLLLCRLYQDTVMCIHQERPGDRAPLVSYERGRPMPMFRGAASKAILAHLPPRQLRRIHRRFADAIADAGLAGGWEAFRDGLAAIRKSGVCVAAGELDPGVVGIAAPVFAAPVPATGRQVLGSLSIAHPGPLDEPALARTVGLLNAAAREIDAAIRVAVDGRAGHA
jgi:DNA-binding IclR family transcriptional regulator